MNNEELNSRISQLEAVVNALLVNAAAGGEADCGLLPVEAGEDCVIASDGGGNPGCYEIQNINKTTHVVTFDNPYYSIGGRIYQGPSEIGNIAAACVVALVIGAEQTRSQQLLTYSDISTIIAAQSDMSKYIIPLYQFDANLDVVCDYRNMVNASMGEFT